MTLTTPALATVTAGEPVTAQAWNAIVTGLGDLYAAVIALGGETLDVAVTVAGAPFPDAVVIAEPLDDGRPVRALPPFGARTAHLLVGLTGGGWRVHVQAPGYASRTVDVTLPTADAVAVALAVDGVVVPDLFGVSLQGALDQVRALRIDADIVLDTTGREVSRTAVPPEFVDAPVLLQLPAAGTVVPLASGRVRLVVASALRRDPVVTMPSIIGLTLAEAQEALERVGLRLGSSSVRDL
jgi:hypothetical protein